LTALLQTFLDSIGVVQLRFNFPLQTPRRSRLQVSAIRYWIGVLAKGVPNSLGGGVRITAIQFFDLWQNGTNANITELNIDASMTSARAVLVSQRGKGIDFLIRVWGH